MMNSLKLLVVLIAVYSCEARNLFDEEMQLDEDLPMSWKEVDPKEELINDLIDYMEATSEELMDDNTVYHKCSYIYHPAPVTFFKAENYCRHLGGQIAFENMLTPNDRKQVLGLFPKGVQAWIGVRYAFGKWRTQNMKTIEHGTFGWNMGEPNNPNIEHCAENWFETTFVNNLNCHKKRSVICEFCKEEKSSHNEPHNEPQAGPQQKIN